MRQELASTLGFYNPTFFHIKIATDEDLSNLPRVVGRTGAAFLHEYIHFLQDLTTTYGLMNINYVVDFVKTVNINQKGQEERAMRLPYTLSAERDGNVFYNSNLMKVYAGSTNSNNAANAASFGSTLKEVTLPGPNGMQTKEITCFHLNIDSGFGATVPYYVGSHCLIESMAYEIELMVYGEILTPPPNLPYRSARYFAELVYPGFCANSLNLIALCDSALMDFDPGKVFYESLVFLRDNHPNIQSAYDIFPLLNSSITGTYQGFDNSFDLFSYMSVSAASQLSRYFTTSVFGDNKIWFDYLVTKSAILRRQFPNFFLDLARGGPIDQNDTFHKVYSQLGIPVVTNNRDSVIFATPHLDANSIKPEMTWAIQQIYNMYINTPRSYIRRCSLSEWCRSSCEANGEEDFTDHRCYESPWERVNDNRLCTFAQIWKSWGMAGEMPTFQQN
jgi:hypothetical protein